MQHYHIGFNRLNFKLALIGPIGKIVVEDGTSSIVIVCKKPIQVGRGWGNDKSWQQQQQQQQCEN